MSWTRLMPRHPLLTKSITSQMLTIIAAMMF